MIGKNGVSFIYFADGAVKTWSLMQEFINQAKTNNDLSAIFTQSNTTIKCGGAPKKIAFLTHARLRDAGYYD